MKKCMEGIKKSWGTFRTGAPLIFVEIRSFTYVIFLKLVDKAQKSCKNSVCFCLTLFFQDFVFRFFFRDLSKPSDTKRTFLERSHFSKFCCEKCCCWEVFATVYVDSREKQAFTCASRKRVAEFHVISRVVFTGLVCFLSIPGCSCYFLRQT